jgi:hypothetical protein
MLPLDGFLSMLRNVMLSSDSVKSSLGPPTEDVIETFWKKLALTSRLEFNPMVVKLLHRLDSKLPSWDVSHVSEEGQDELRVLTHGTIRGCDCFHCLTRPHMESKKEELWESKFFMVTELLLLHVFTNFVRNACDLCRFWGLRHSSAHGLLDGRSSPPAAPLRRISMEH